MTRTIKIDSPGCENEFGVCPYLDAGVCWGDDASAELGAGRSCVDCGPDCHPRYERHVDCPFGSRTVVIRMTAARKEVNP